MVFIFSSRRRHTRYCRDWSSDVCSSDLAGAFLLAPAVVCAERVADILDAAGVPMPADVDAGEVRHLVRPHRHSEVDIDPSSEERRVGKECRSRWSPDLLKKIIQLIARRM